METFNDLWIVGDEFVQDTHNTLQTLLYQAVKNRQKASMYLQEHYNVHMYFKNASNGVKWAIGRIINSLIEAINEHHRLPKLILIMIDKDIVNELEALHADQIVSTLWDSVNWLMRQFNTTIHRKMIQLLEMKPGAV